jgi:hypothetical protein
MPWRITSRVIGSIGGWAVGGILIVHVADC